MSLETITEINLDTNQPGLEVVHAKQYDTTRKVKAHLFDCGIKWLVPSSNYVAVVAFKKSDRIGGFYDHTESGVLAVSVDSSDRSIVTIVLDRNTVTTAGLVSVEITFYDSITTGRLSTFSFRLNVEQASLSELDLSSNPYFNILAEDIQKVLEAEASMTGMTASATKVSPETTDINPTVTGGTGTGVPYNIEFKVPQGVKGDPPTPTGSTYRYAVSTSGTTVPAASEFNSGTAPVKGEYYWTEVTTTWNNNGTSINYFVSYAGMDGDGSTASDIICADSLTVQEKFNQINFSFYDRIDEIISGYDESSKTATIVDIWNALPDKSCAVLHAGFIKSTAVPNVYGCVEIVRWNLNRAWIYFHSSSGIDGDYTMGFTNNVPSGTWTKVK